MAKLYCRSNRLDDTISAAPEVANICINAITWLVTPSRYHRNQQPPLLLSYKEHATLATLRIGTSMSISPSFSHQSTLRQHIEVIEFTWKCTPPSTTPSTSEDTAATNFLHLKRHLDVQPVSDVSTRVDSAT